MRRRVAKSTKPVLFAEPWYNTIRSANRVLVIHRHSGRCRNLVITPRHRFMFRAELLHARDGTDPLAAAAMAGASTVVLVKPKPGPAESSSPNPAKNAA